MNIHQTIQTLIISTLLTTLAPTLLANTANSEQLNNIRQAIAATQKDLREKEAAQKQTQATLEKTRIELEKVQRELEELNQQQQTAWNKLQALQATLTRLQIEIASTKAQVSRLLIANYKNRRPNAVVLFLKDADPNQKSRFLNYTRYINESNDRVLHLLGQQQQELNTQETAINTELERLHQLTIAQQQKMRELGQNRSKAQTVSKQLNAEINKQKAYLAKLQADEQRLNQVISHISQRKTQATQIAETDQPNPENTVTPPNNIGLGQRQGRLPLPTQGQITGQFGHSRTTGGTWRGLFIETKASPVKSIAEGYVSYADNLAGYGNTIIIDHGLGYMSIYAGLSKMNVREGLNIQANQTIGTTGKLPAGEEGLYFELRYRGQTINPHSWVK